MRTALVILVLVLVVLVGLPLAMADMSHGGEMRDCSACLAPNDAVMFGLCVGVLALLAIGMMFRSSRVSLLTRSEHRFIVSSSIFRPPRSV